LNEISQATTRINWLEYSPEAFEKAKIENKPVLLAISAVWCHWCHIQDKTTYSDPGVIRTINRDYVPIRVDNDRRPDINRRYNMGGWPTTAFLTPTGDVITGGTYIPPDQMKTILREVRDHYLRNKSAYAKRSIEPAAESSAIELSNELIDNILGSLVANFDPLYGGFGDEPKFPHPDALELALAQHWYSGDKGLRTIVTKTLDRMANGGIYDSIEGGFFRYSTSRDWKIPHYEKMCEDNARLLAVYLHAYQATGTEEYRKVANGIVHYVNTTLSDQQAGGFYGSQDADEEYYKLSRSKRTDAEAPNVDRTLYTNWNGLMIYAYLEAAQLLDDRTLTEFALKSIERIIDDSLDHDTAAMCHYLSNEKTRLSGLLVDQVAFSHALIKANETTGDKKYLERAQRLIRYMDETLLDARNGGYYDTVPGADSPGYLNRPVKPFDENSLASILLMKLYQATGVEAYHERARSTLTMLSAEYMRQGHMTSMYGLALDLFLNEPTRIAIVGPLQEPRTRQLLNTSLRAYDPRKIVIPLDPETDGERLNSLGFTPEPQPRAYICVGKTCYPPLSEPEEIVQQLSRNARTDTEHEHSRQI
jgi:uncharacterized protein YyaL (SSP411 family)